jgi:hypothetical protein
MEPVLMTHVDHKQKLYDKRKKIQGRRLACPVFRN